jgi:hypothetical protein
MSDRNFARRGALVALLVTLACHAVPAPLRAADEASPEPERSSATLPLDEILQLYRERDEATRKEGPPPLVAASLQKVALSGRLLDDGIDFEGHFEISVLTDDEWVQVPLFAHDAGTHLTRLPDVKGGAFAVRDGELVFLTRKRGRYAFDLSLFRTAGKQDRMRRLSIGHGEAALATCRLDIDGGLFRLRTERSVETRDGVRVLAGDDGFEIEWEVIGEIESGVGEAVSAPAIESVVSRVHASTVSTLKGRRITRILYELRFAGRKSIAIGIPKGQVVERAFQNGVAIEAVPAGGALALELTPARAGEEGGTLELVLADAGNGFHLAGDLRFELPTASWPVHELFYTLHLPRVFDYRWTGGSLEPAESSPAAGFSYRVPLPGRSLHLHQVLIADSSPDVTLDYAVNLDGHYFQDPSQSAN